MLILLRVRNLAIVKDVSLEWGEGLNLLTGETGAGKSILVDALGLALGDRATADLVRSGEEKAEVEAVFHIDEPGPDPVRSLLASAGLEAEGGEIVVRREIGDGSRSRQFLCDAPVSLSMLRKFGDLVVEIQGQHQHHALLAADAQREALDRFASLESPKAKVAELAHAANQAQSTLVSLEARVADSASRLDYLSFQVRELEALGPSEADERNLRAERALLQQASRRRELAENVYRILYEDELSILGGIGRACADLQRLGEIDPEMETFAGKLDQAARLIEDAALDVRDYRGRAEPDPGRLEEIGDRLAEYERLARKHRTTPDALSARLVELKQESASLDHAEGLTRSAREEARALRESYLVEARAVSARRKAGARRLASALREELTTLAMKHSEVAIVVEPEALEAGAPCREQGLDRVEIRLSTNPGEPPRALANVASGGELSRVMLAVNGVLGEGRRKRTLIFDEVDAGIGGRVAAVVGEKLRTLAAAHQVIVVTHLPQIASLADRHFAVEKRVEKGRTMALVRELRGQERVAEVARMMGGTDVSPIARRHAADLLLRSRGSRAGMEPDGETATASRTREAAAASRLRGVPIDESRPNRTSSPSRKTQRRSP